MPRGSVGETVGNMFGDLKSRLGFDQGNNRDEDYDGYDSYDSYDEYGDFDEYEEYGEGYDDTAPVGGYRPLTSTAATSRPASRYSRSDVSSSLVSIDDVKASTPLPPSVPSSLMRDPLDDAGMRSAGAYGSTRNAFDTTPATLSSAYTAPQRAADQAAAPSSAVPFAAAQNSAGATGTTSGSGYDPYEAYSSQTPSTHVPVRTLTVLKPTSYGDVERVARAVKSGDVVVLAMRYTPDELSKRILDFSFGVASALDANVECPGDKVFAIARGSALTLDERRRLGAQGVL